MILDVDTLLPAHTFFANRGVGDLGTGGDTQVIFLGTDTIWSGCHCWGSVGEYELFSYNSAANGVQTYDEYVQWFTHFATIDPFGQQPVRGGYGIDINSESLVPLTFDVLGQTGAYAIYEDSNGRVWFGGQYTRDTANDRVINGIARFSPISAAPSGPANFRSTLQTRERIVLTWDAVPGATSYEVRRDGVAVSSRSSRWFTDLNRDAGTTYTYTVRAQLADGSFTESSGPLSVTTVGDPVVLPPQNFRSTLQTRERIVLTWDRVDGATSYEVRRWGRGLDPDLSLVHRSESGRRHDLHLHRAGPARRRRLHCIDRLLAVSTQP
ncbi:MAG: fibronectin type III domain-containing protein [Acidimicrobiales bacterium]